MSRAGYNPVRYRKSYSYHPRFDLKPAAELLVTKIFGDTVEKEPWSLAPNLEKIDLLVTVILTTLKTLKSFN